MSRFDHVGTWSDVFREPAHDLLDLAGKPVRLSTRVQTGIDEDYGDPITETFHTETVAEVVFRGTPSFSRRHDGIDTSISAIGWIKDDVEIPIDEETSGTPYATRLHILTDETDGGHALSVFKRFDENNGKIRLHCVNYND